MHNRKFSGNTLLHGLIINYSNLTEFRSNIEKIGINSDSIKIYSVTRNHKGKLPIELVSLLNISSDENNVYDILLNIMKPDIKSSLNQELCFESVIKKYSIAKDSSIYHNLKLGVKVANAIRKMIIDSSTHPQINGYSKSDYKKLDDEVESDRDEVERKRFEIIYQSSDTQYHKIISGDCIKINLSISDITYRKIIENQNSSS
ncbi:MAG: hypothetical protein KIT56_06875 [Gammaproteobacteria bacterium]|nr:hypothetical protein [Gammaproteobacteria bacterium]